MNYLIPQLNEEDLLADGGESSLTSVDYNELDRGFCSWIASIFTLSDDKYLRKASHN